MDDVGHKYGTYLSIIVLLIFFTLPLQAGITGKIAGIVTDSGTGEPLIGANVIIKAQVNSGRIIEFEPQNIIGASTDEDGEYFILNVPPGNYVLEALYVGYTTVQTPDIKVSVDHTARANFELQQAIEFTETVVVTAQREMIKKDLTSSIVMVDAEEIERLPVREIGDVIELQAGVVRDAGGDLHIRGGRSTEIAYLIDGVQIIDPLNRNAGLTVDNQAVQELQTITGTFNAEYGQALSGVINTITKRGSKQFVMNVNAFFGDYWSTDDSKYFVMDNTEWAKAMAQLYAQEFPIDYNGPFDPVTESHLTQENYLTKFNPVNSRDIQANISGPVPFLGNDLTYFISGRYRYDPGFIYGKRYFMPWGYSQPQQYADQNFSSPDNEIVPLSTYEAFTLQAKLFFRVLDNLNLSYAAYLNDSEGKGVGYGQKYVPDSGKKNLTFSQTHIFSINHILSSNTFYEVKASYFDKDFENYLYEDPFDPRYIPQLYEANLVQQYLFGGYRSEDVLLSPPDDFSWLGNETDRGKIRVKFVSAQLDLSTQVDKHHFLKFGILGRYHDLYNRRFDLQFTQNEEGLVVPVIPATNSPYYTEYQYNPREFAAYIQDKIEYDELIINVGLRFDYLDSDGRVLADPSDPQIYNPFNPYHKYKNYTPETATEDLVEYTVSEREEFWYKKVDPKYQISPRFGLSFPVSETGVIHFSYGWFFQSPEFSRLYQNTSFWIYGAGAQNLVGNADLNAERTISYEVGLQQQLFDNFFFHLIGFYRDIRDWVGISPPINTYGARTTYYKYVNKDHATSQGVTFTGTYSRKGLAVTLDYTFMVAKGTTSDPQDAYNDAFANRAPRLQLIPLHWDQTHNFIMTASYSHQTWYGSLVGRVQSGFPYTPTEALGEAVGSAALVGFRENSASRPATYNVDLRLSKTFMVWDSRLELSLNVFNLFDIDNARTVYSDTGRPDYTTASRRKEDRISEIASIQELYNNPGNYYSPRFIQLGLGFRL